MRGRTRRFLIFISIFFIYTSYKSMQLWPTEPLATVALTLLFFVLMLSATFIHRGNPKAFHKSWFKVLARIGSICTAFWAIFFVLSIPFDLLRVGIYITRFFVSSPLIGAANIAHLYQEIYWALFGVSLCLAFLGWAVVMRGPKIKEIDVPIENLAPALRGLKIAQISDLHVGSTLRKRFVEEVVQRVNSTHADLLFLTGDIADAHAQSIDEDLKPLANLQSRYGTFYITGNHEYYWNATDLIAKAKELGFRALLNENEIVRIGDSKLMVAGITDPAGGEMLRDHAPDAAKAAATKEDTQLKILLSHRPGACYEAEKLGFDLQFSGHTHAGQFFPFSLLIGFFHEYSRGLYRHLRMWVYVNPGTGHWGPANRLGVTPEISVIKLVPAT